MKLSAFPPPWSRSFSCSHTSYNSYHTIIVAADRSSAQYRYHHPHCSSRARTLFASFATSSPKHLFDMPGQKLKDKSSTMNALERNFEESPLEAQSRVNADFPRFEAQLPKRFSRSEMGLIDRGTCT
jgi:hypothetical protein